jgi:hypothetical protein
VNDAARRSAPPAFAEPGFWPPDASRSTVSHVVVSGELIRKGFLSAGR